MVRLCCSNLLCCIVKCFTSWFTHLCCSTYLRWFTCLYCFTNPDWFTHFHCFTCLNWFIKFVILLPLIYPHIPHCYHIVSTLHSYLFFNVLTTNLCLSLVITLPTYFTIFAYPQFLHCLSPNIHTANFCYYLCLSPITVSAIRLFY